MTADIVQMLTEAANRYGIPPAVAIAQAQQESGGQQYNSDGSLKVSKAGAIGVMQLEPATAADLGVDPSDTAQNIDGGVRYLSQLLRQFNGNMQLALAAYDWGPGHVQRNGFLNWPQETMTYVNRILGSASAAVSDVFTGGPAPADSTDPTAGGSAPTSNDLVLILFVGGLFLSLLLAVRS